MVAVPFRFLPIRGKIFEEDVEVSDDLGEYPKLSDLVTAIRAKVGKRCPMAGFRLFINNLPTGDVEKLLHFHLSERKDTLTIMELPLQAVMP